MTLPPYGDYVDMAELRLDTAGIDVPEAGAWPQDHPNTIDSEHCIANLSRAKLSEVAVADLFDGVRNAETDTDGDDGGYDVRLPNGDTIDVKSTRYRDGNLLIPNYMVGSLRADYYLLTIVPDGDDVVRVVGFATPDMILDKPTITDFPKPCKKLEPAELRDPELLHALTDGGRERAMEKELNAQ